MITATHVAREATHVVCSTRCPTSTVSNLLISEPTVRLESFLEPGQDRMVLRMRLPLPSPLPAPFLLLLLLRSPLLMLLLLQLQLLLLLLLLLLIPLLLPFHSKPN